MKLSDRFAKDALSYLELILQYCQKSISSEVQQKFVHQLIENKNHIKAEIAKGNLYLSLEECRCAEQLINQGRLAVDDKSWGLLSARVRQARSRRRNGSKDVSEQVTRIQVRNAVKARLSRMQYDVELNSINDTIELLLDSYVELTSNLDVNSKLSALEDHLTSKGDPHGLDGWSKEAVSYRRAHGIYDFDDEPLELEDDFDDEPLELENDDLDGFWKDTN